MKQFVKRSKWALVGYSIAQGCKVRLRFSLGHIDSASGSTHQSKSVAESVAYINHTYDDYLRIGRLTADWLQGKRILEGGPGDNLGVALRFVATGAAQVVPVDKFYARRDSEQQRQIYLALRAGLRADERHRYDRAVDLSSGVAFNEELITPTYGRGLEELGDLFDRDAFDVIVSRAVIQEIYDAERAFAGMDKVLRPDGVMVHKIDLSDYGLFSGNGHHPLEFLTIPDVVYAWMARNSDRRVSRRTVDYYRRTMAHYGYDGDLLITMVTRPGCAKPREVSPHKPRLTYGVDYSDETLALVRSIRPRLAGRFRTLSDEELMVAGIFMVARKR